MMDMPFYRPTVVEIDLDAMSHNVEFFRNKIPEKTKLMAIVKADAYGHGSVPVVKHLKTIGVRYFAVAFLDEAIELRRAGIFDPILILGYTPNHGVEQAYKYDIALTVFTKDKIDQIHKVGKRLRKKLRIHIKVDTGMGRIGLFPSELHDFILYTKKSPWIQVEGIFTHFSTADEKDKSFTLKQYEQFKQEINKIKTIEKIPYIHLSNSAAMIDLPELEQTMARLGISLYGLPPSKEVHLSAQALKPVMSFKTKVIYIKKLNIGQTVSYGATFKATRETMVATLPIGYADGLPRRLSNKGYVLIHGQKAPIIGRICMDQTMIDVTDIPGVKPYDEVIIYGKQDHQYISVDENAQMLDMINYELVTMIGKRIPRLYRKDKEIIEVVNHLSKDKTFTS